MHLRKSHCWPCAVLTSIRKRVWDSAQTWALCYCLDQISEDQAPQESGDSWHHQGSIIFTGSYSLFFLPPSEKAVCLESIPLNETHIHSNLVSGGPDFSVLDWSPTVHKWPQHPLVKCTGLATLVQAGAYSSLSIYPWGVGQGSG